MTEEQTKLADAPSPGGLVGDGSGAPGGGIQLGTDGLPLKVDEDK